MAPVVDSSGFVIGSTQTLIPKRCVAVSPWRSPTFTADFVAFVLSSEGQAVLARHGFAPPP